MPKHERDNAQKTKSSKKKLHLPDEKPIAKDSSTPTGKTRKITKEALLKMALETDRMIKTALEEATRSSELLREIRLLREDIGADSSVRVKLERELDQLLSKYK